MQWVSGSTNKAKGNIPPAALLLPLGATGRLPGNTLSAARLLAPHGVFHTILTAATPGRQATDMIKGVPVLLHGAWQNGVMATPCCLVATPQPTTYRNARSNVLMQGGARLGIRTQPLGNAHNHDAQPPSRNSSNSVLFIPASSLHNPPRPSGGFSPPSSQSKVPQRTSFPVHQSGYRY